MTQDMSIGVIIPVFGKEDERFLRLAQRARHSVFDQTVLPRRAVISLRSTLSEARNFGAEQCEDCEWLIFLDADDELDLGYIEAMREGAGDLRWPSTIGVYEDGGVDKEHVLLRPKTDLRSLIEHNWMIIGSMVRRELFMKVGGFRELPMLEDWDLWIRCVLAGAVPEPCEKAIYKVHVIPGSRNNPDTHGAIYTQIQNTYISEWRRKFG
jgi:glycosyltransferase involved in cell wall biosynthesis